MDTAWIGAISALGGALIGASVSLAQLVLSHKRELSKHDDTLLLSAFNLLCGNETQRSSGLSIIEGRFIESEEYIDILIPALTSQAVYLLLHTESSTSRTEFHNWLRIMTLLEALLKRGVSLGDFYDEVGNSFLIKADKDYSSGLDISRSTLELWAEKYGMDNLDVDI